MMTNKTIKLSNEDQFSVFHRIAERKRKQNLNPKPVTDNSLYFKDENGREYINKKEFDRLHKIEIRQKAIEEHGNDKNKRLDLCGFPKGNREFMFNYDYKEVLSKFSELDIKNTSWIFIYGSPGTGKTTLSMRLIWEWMKPEPARKSTFLSVRDWMQEQYQKFGNDEINEIPELPHFKKYIILDDFDKIGFTEWQILQLFRLVDYLERNDKKVILTSNHSLSDLLQKSKYDINYKAILDRIAGRTKKAILCMDGKSMRNPNFEI